MRKDHPSTPHGFTLVELLVVVGIIGLLIGILLPVISGVQARGRDLKCQANLRSIIQAMHGYAAENNGSMPWGFIHHNPLWGVGGGAGAGNDGRYFTWASLLGKYLNKHSSGILHDSQIDFKTEIPGIVQCPEADQWREHVVSYAVNYIVCPTPMHEFAWNRDGFYGSLRRPMRLTQLRRDSALVWDTAILEDQLMRPHFRIGVDIDGQRIANGNVVPQLRYYTDRDIWADVAPGIYAQHLPIQLDVAGRIFYNREPGSIAAEGGRPYPYQGNLRFRHQKNTTCNVAFSDGSVRQFTAKMNPDKTVKSHDAIRRYFMIRWPAGVEPHPDYPH